MTVIFYPVGLLSQASSTYILNDVGERLQPCHYRSRHIPVIHRASVNLGIVDLTMAAVT